MVMDFGLASELREGLTRVAHQTMSGTPAYMAPEQHVGTVKRESDIFAMGVCLYEMVAGTLPGATTMATRKAMWATRTLLVEGAIDEAMDAEFKRRAPQRSRPPQRRSSAS